MSTWSLREMAPNEGRDLQALFVRCADFFEISQGGPPERGQAQDQFSSLPPGASHIDKAVLAIVDEDGTMIGAVDFVYGWPDGMTIMLGLLLLEPDARRQGIGSQVLEGLLGMWRAEGFQRVRIGVVAGNVSGRRFWERHDFAEVKREPRPNVSGGEVLVMVRLLERDA